MPQDKATTWIHNEACRARRQTFDISLLLKYSRLGVTGVKRARQTKLSRVKLTRDLIAIDLGSLLISEQICLTHCPFCCASCDVKPPHSSNMNEKQQHMHKCGYIDTISTVSCVLPHSDSIDMRSVFGWAQLFRPFFPTSSSLCQQVSLAAYTFGNTVHWTC